MEDRQKVLKVCIRWMTERDVSEVLQIENQSFKQAWDKDDFLRCRRQRNCLCMVVEHDNKVVGFMIYELYRAEIRVLNFAVHPEWRHQGIGAQMVAKLVSKLFSQRRTKITALVPESCEGMSPFFRKYGVEIRLTERKGQITYRPVLKAMTREDVGEAQEIENDFMGRYGKEPRDIGAMITNGARYGIVARDNSGGELLGYVLYARELSGIDLNGEFGIIVKPECRKRGIGRKLMLELVNQQLPITVSDIYLFCKEQVGFLKAMGVPVPKPEKYVTVKWQPQQAIS